MFSIGNKSDFPISLSLSKYIRDSTNKSLEKYKNKITHTAINKNDDNPKSFIYLLIFISGVSFLVGYKLGKLNN
jgi:hypothetical protein